MDKGEISRVLEEIGTLLELKGENPFRCRAYYNAARAIAGVEDDIKALARDGRLAEIKGIGAGIAEKVAELVNTGRSKYYEDLKKSIPPGLVEMLRISGMGPKKIQAVHLKLKIDTVAKLEEACRANRLTDLEGFGEKSQDKILEGIESMRKNAERHRYDAAFSQARMMLDALTDRRIKRKSLAGSLRRNKELIRDIDILISAQENDAGALMDLFTGLPLVDRVAARGHTKSSVVLKSGINVDLRIVRDDEFPYALHYFTGSAEHNTALRARAKKMGLKLNEYGLFREDETNLKCKNEEEIFKALGLVYIPPELRENQGEIEAAERKRIPKLISDEDIKGVFHVHSVWSDGHASLREMIRACVDLGYEYVGISDHSKSAAYANGLKEDRVLEQHRELDALQKEIKEIRIFKGTEADILQDGTIDYDEEVWKSFDFIIASIHSRFNMSEKDMTRRIIRAMENPHVTMIGHPTGRLLLGREPYAVNLHEVIDAAREYGVVMELNANPHRFDLDWRHCPYAKSKGVRVSVNPDAHSVEDLKMTPFGVGIARKGWLEPKDVLNTMTAEAVADFLKRRKNRGKKAGGPK